MTITIKDKELTLKYGFRAMMIFENISGKSFNLTNLQDVVYYFYSCVCAGMKENYIDFDDFLEYLDENPTIFEEFNKWLSSEVAKQNTLSAKKDTKKKTTK